MKIKSFNFSNSGVETVANVDHGQNWPVVYLIHDANDLYIGETTNVSGRMKNHLQSQEKRHLKSIKIVFDETYNKSVVLDFEQRLIKYCESDKLFKNILNKNAGQSSAHEYYNRSAYNNKFRELWSELIKHGMAKTPIDILENENIFKYSPYTALTEEQNDVSIDVLKEIIKSLSSNTTGTAIVDGCAGTGKTVLAISLINSLANATKINIEDLTTEQLLNEKTKVLLTLKKLINQKQPLKIGFVFPMTGIRSVMEMVFDQCGNGLSKHMVLNPNQVKNQQYDILFVDESHRLSKRLNLTNYNDFDKTCHFFNLDPKKANQLDWIMRSAKYKVLFYDKDQSIKSSDISYDEFHNSINSYEKNIVTFKLRSQMRCLGGNTYIKYIKDIMECKKPKKEFLENYRFKIFDNIASMINTIIKLDKRYSLCRTVSGYSWEWKTKPEKEPKDNMIIYNNLVRKNAYDIEIQGHKYIWNLTTKNWITRKDARYTIGCIHTTQGFDLNYVGVIFGREIDYNPITKQIEVDLDKFYDKKVKASTKPEIVKQYIINAYTTMMARGIKGCYVYAYNENLRNYLKKYIDTEE